MTTSHPMEQVYINQIRQMSVAVMRREISVDEHMAKLELHRERAQKMGWVRYHASVLNAIALAHSQNLQTSSEMILDIFHKALAYAQEADDIELQCTLLSNLSIETLNTLYDIDATEQYIDRTVELLNTSEQQSSIGYLYTLCNKIRFRLWAGDFTTAGQLLEQAWIQTEQVTVPGSERNAYARVVLLLRHEQAQVDIATGNCDAAMQAIRLNQELFAGVYGLETDPVYEIDMALYKLICEKDDAAFVTHLNATLPTDDLFDVIECLRYVEYLKHLEYIPQAQMMLDKAIAMVDQPDFTRHKTDIFEGFVTDLHAELDESQLKN